jgi:hypothetical protein
MSPAAAQGTAFTYQGQIQNNGSTANGTFNLTFALFDASTNGISVAGPVTNNGVLASNGLFTVLVDFGSGVFTGQTNWLEIGVETNGAATFTTLEPRQQLTPTPFAVFAGTANSVSGGLSGDVTGTQNATLVSSVGGQSAALVASGTAAANAATPANTPGTIVQRDASGNFSASAVTATTVSASGAAMTDLNPANLVNPYPITNVNMYVVGCYGDSLTSGADGNGTTYPISMSLVNHRYSYNYGVSGQPSGPISTRMMADSNNFGTYILWSGRDNYNAVATNAPFSTNAWCTNQPFNDICYDCNWAYTNGNKRLLVLSIINGISGSWPGTEGRGTMLYSLITNLDTQISNQVAQFAAAGQSVQYFDIREWLVQQANLAEYPTTGETNNLLYDFPAYHLITPTSGPHLNSTGYYAVGSEVAGLLSVGFPNGNLLTVEGMMSLLSSNGYSFNPQEATSPLLFPSLYFAPGLGFNVASGETALNFAGNIQSANHGNLGSTAEPFGQVNSVIVNASTVVSSNSATSSTASMVNGVIYFTNYVGTNVFTGTIGISGADLLTLTSNGVQILAVGTNGAIASSSINNVGDISNSGDLTNAGAAEIGGSLTVNGLTISANGLGTQPSASPVLIYPTGLTNLAGFGGGSETCTGMNNYVAYVTATASIFVIYNAAGISQYTTASPATGLVSISLPMGWGFSSSAPATGSALPFP